MSTIGAVINDTGGLLDAFDALLKSDTAQQAPSIADALKMRPQLDRGIRAARDVVAGIAANLEQLRRLAVFADAGIGMFGVFRRFAAATGDAAQELAATLGPEDLDLRGASAVARQTGGALGELSGALQVAEDAAETALAFIDPGSFTGLLLSLRHLETTLDTFGQLAAAAPAGNGGGLSPPAT